jgi:hypothetical protein
VQITARVVAAAGKLRQRRAYHAIRRALRTALGRADFRVVELCIRARRLELIVEADDRMALARGMQGFQVAAARHLNRAWRRRGCVFADRYRARPLTTRRAVRRALRDLPDRERTCSPMTWLWRIDGAPRRRPRPTPRRRARPP